jgi:hypothetical protein
MQTMTYSTARQNLAGLLDAAAQDGEAWITRRDGRRFSVKPVALSGGQQSVLDVPGVQLPADVHPMSADQLLALLRESREEMAERATISPQFAPAAPTPRSTPRRPAG